MQCRLLNSRLTRWTIFLQEYDINIIYCKGSENILADTLSRYPSDKNQEADSPSSAKKFYIAKLSVAYEQALQNMSSLREEQTKDKVLAKIISALKLGKSKSNYAKWFLFHDDLLWRRSIKNSEGCRLCIPKHHVTNLVIQEHELHGHFGALKCYLVLKKYYYFSKMKERIRKVVATCHICQLTKSSIRCQGERHSVLVTKPLELICLDLMGPLPQSRGGATYLLVLLDAFSKLVKLYPIKRATTIGIIKRLQHFIIEIGKPMAILSDNGTQFSSKKWKNFLGEQSIKIKYTSSYYPQGNNTERVNREIGRLLRMLCHEKHTKWACVINAVEGYLNNVIHDSTGFTPLEVHCGQSRAEPLLKSLIPDAGIANVSNKEIWVLARQRLISKAEKRKLRHDKYNRITTFNPGDLVLVRAHRQSSAEDREIKKFFLLYEGPFIISRCVGANSYELKERNTNTIIGNHNIQNLKPYLPPICE